MSDQLRVTTLQAEHIATLYSMYRTQTDGLPHNLAPSLERFQAALLGYTPDSILVAEDQGVVQGFAALAHVKDDQDSEADAIVALFTMDVAAGFALVEACVVRAGAGPLLAFPRGHRQCPVPGYNAGWDGLSAQLPAIARILTHYGFQPYYHEWLMSCTLGEEPEGQCSNASVEHPSETGDAMREEISPIDGVIIRAGISEEDEFIQRAWVAEECIGLCFYSTLAPISDDPPAVQIGYIDWLWLNENHRRRGIARELLRRALAHLRSLGCRVCWLTTGAENWAAQPLYQSFGFTMVDTATSFQYMRNSSQ